MGVNGTYREYNRKLEILSAYTMRLSTVGQMQASESTYHAMYMAKSGTTEAIIKLIVQLLR